MWQAYDFGQHGGQLLSATYVWEQLVNEHVTKFLGEDFLNQGNAYTFGWKPDLENYARAISGRPTFHSIAPHLAGGWDGKTSISLWELGKKVTGSYLPAQKQTLGTCTSRGTSATLNLLQQALIAAGKLNDWKPVAHAPIYGGGREIGNMLAPPGRDGCTGDMVSQWCIQGGLCSLEDIQDRYDSDEIAGQYGYRGVPAEVKKLCLAHLAKNRAPVTNFQEAADAIFSGRPVMVCSSQGFSMHRGQGGFCQAQGRWDHCMHFGAVIVSGGQRGLGCGQSWGSNTPDGPTLPGCPDHVFGVEEDVVNRMLSMHDSFTFDGVDGWSKPEWKLDWRLW